MQRREFITAAVGMAAAVVGEGAAGAAKKGIEGEAGAATNRIEGEAGAAKKGIIEKITEMCARRF
jgi:hypothetical protein